MDNNTREGKCFYYTAQIMAFPGSIPANLEVCHAICVGSNTEWMGKLIAHSWVEFKINGHRIAYDPVTCRYSHYKQYRRKHKIKYIKIYKRTEFLSKWQETNNPGGPWDKKIHDYTLYGGIYNSNNIKKDCANINL